MSETLPADVLAKHPKLAELLPKLDTLKKSLDDKDPKMPQHLKEIHKYLIQFEELAHLLSEEQIAIILSGQQIQVGVVLAAETKAKEKKGSKDKISADDL